MAKSSHGATAPHAPEARHATQAHHGGKPAVRSGYYRGDDYRAETSVGYMMKQIVELLSRALDQRMSEFGLTDAQWRPLLFLTYQPQTTATQLARAVGCDSGATTRMLDRLEDKGMLHRVRSTDDRRVQQIELTDAGRKAAAVVPHVIADVLNAHTADLSHAEIEQLAALLHRVLETSRREVAAACADAARKP